MINTTFGFRFEASDLRHEVFWQEVLGITDNPMAAPAQFFKNSRRFIFHYSFL